MSTFSAALAFGFDREFGCDPADDVVFADVDVDVRLLERLFDFALGFVELRQRQRPGGFQRGAAGRVFGELEDLVDRARRRRGRR